MPKSRRMSETAKSEQHVHNLLYLLIIVVVILALLGASQGVINFVVQIFVSAIVGAMLSLVCVALVEELTGDTLKGIWFIVEVYGLKFSASAFVIATTIVQFALFR